MLYQTQIGREPAPTLSCRLHEGSAAQRAEVPAPGGKAANSELANDHLKAVRQFIRTGARCLQDTGGNADKIRTKSDRLGTIDAVTNAA